MGSAGTTRRTRQAAAAEEEARATPAMAVPERADAGDEVPSASSEAVEVQAVPQTSYLTEDRDATDAVLVSDTSVLPPGPQDSMETAKRPQISKDQQSLPEPTGAEPVTAAPSIEEPQLAAAEPEGGEREEQAAAKEEAAADPAQAEGPAGVSVGIDEDMEEDIEVDFEDAQDVFETPSQHPRMMTPGTSFGTARQQPTAYKTGQEHMTGGCPRHRFSIYRLPKITWLYTSRIA